MPRPVRFLLVAFGLLGSPALAGEVHVVDASGGPGADFTNVGAALAAAADGDILLLRQGDYALGTPPSLYVGPRSIVIVGESGATVNGSIVVDELQPGQWFAVRGLTSTDDVDLGFAVEGYMSSGLVWLEECRFGSYPALFSSYATRFVGTRAILLRSDFVGAGAYAFETSVLAHGCTFLGESGHLGTFDTGFQVLSNAFLYAAGSTFQSWLPVAYPDLVVDSTARAVLLDSVAENVDGVVTLQAGSARSYEATGLVRENQSLSLTAEGASGELVFVLVSRSPAGAFVGEIGALEVGPLATLPVFLGTVPAGGTLNASVTMPTLPAGVEGTAFFTQAAFFAPSTSELHLSGGSMVVLIDEKL